MKKLIFICLLMVAQSSLAGVYKCVDTNGNKRYQNSPCPNLENTSTFNPVTGTSNKVVDNRQLDLAMQQEIQREKISAEKQLQEEQQRQQQLKQQILSESQKNQEWVKQHPKRYSAFAIPPYAENKHPEFADNFLDRLPEIEQFRRLGAELALASGKCGRVEAVELNYRSQATSLVFLVDCSSGESFLLNESQIQQAKR